MAYIRSKQPEIAHVFITPGCFFEWGTHSLLVYTLSSRLGLQSGILGLDIPNAKCTIYDDGKHGFNATTFESIGHTVVTVLSTPSNFVNKDIRVHDFWITQWELKALVEEVTGLTYTVSYVDTSKLFAESQAAIAKGEYTHERFLGVIAGVVFGKHTCGWGPDDDTAFVGLPPKDVKVELIKVLKG